MVSVDGFSMYILCNAQITSMFFLISAVSKPCQVTLLRIIILQLSVLMGLSWSFGFLTQVIQGYAMLFVFVILNSLQGLLIFLSFCFTARVRRLLGEKYGRGQSSDRRRKTRRKPGELVDTTGTNSQSIVNLSHTANTDTTRL